MYCFILGRAGGGECKAIRLLIHLRWAFALLAREENKLLKLIYAFDVFVLANVNSVVLEKNKTTHNCFHGQGVWRSFLVEVATEAWFACSHCAKLWLRRTMSR